jgi:GAF domain-containing protein
MKTSRRLHSQSRPASSNRRQHVAINWAEATQFKVPIPENEPERLAALQRYEILDTPCEPSFDDITLLASMICNTPIALLSLVDSDRQWFKSKVGLTISETARDVAFCAHAILEPDLFVVRDATRDRRFANSPLVKSSPKIRFYAGAPLVTPEQHALGTLCVIDRKPRTLGKKQLDALRALSRLAMRELELRRELHELKRATQKTRPSACGCGKR